MNIVNMKLSEIERPEHNIRMHTQKQLREYERSVRMFGQIRPIVIDENDTILCGVGLYLTLINMGADVADVYKVTGLSENQKKKLMIADNKIFGLGIDDLDTLNEFLESLDGDLDVPGFDEEILKSMVAEAEEVTSTISKYGTVSDEEIAAINISKARKDELISKAPTDPSPLPSAEGEEKSIGQATEAFEVKKSVICPECGCELWL